MKLLPFFLSFVLLAACGSEDDVQKDEAHEQLATEVSIFASKDNQKEWMLLADTVNFADAKNATLSHPSLLLKQDGKDSARITGETGSFDYSKRWVEIKGNAVIESFTEHLTIKTNRFFYNIDTDTIWSDGKTVITREGASITAEKGVETNSKLTKIEFRKQTTHVPSSVKNLTKK